MFRHTKRINQNFLKKYFYADPLRRHPFPLYQSKRKKDNVHDIYDNRHLF